MEFLGIDPIDDEELARRRAESEEYAVTHATWDAIEASVREEGDELDEELRDRAAQALRTVRPHLGEAWPRRFFWSDARIASFLGNRAAWTAKMLVVLAHDIEAASTVAGWQRVRRRLQSPLDADPALLELEAGVRAINCELRVSFEPTAQGAKRADLLIRGLERGSPHLYAECTSIQAFPESSADARRTSAKLHPALRLLDTGLQAGGSLTRPVSQAELEELATLTTTFYEKCRTRQMPGELDVDDLLHVWATPAAHPNAEAFIAAHGGEMTFSVAFKYDPMVRLAATIDRKASKGQLPRDQPSLVLLEPSRMVWQLPLERIRIAVRNAMLPYGHLAATALVHRHLGEEPSRLIDLSQSDFATIQTLYAPVQETIVLVWNPARGRRHADAMIDRMFMPKNA